MTGGDGDPQPVICSLPRFRNRRHQLVGSNLFEVYPNLVDISFYIYSGTYKNFFVKNNCWFLFRKVFDIHDYVYGSFGLNLYRIEDLV